MSKYYLVASHYNIYTKNYEKEVIIKEIDGIKYEPYEDVQIEVPEESVGTVIEALAMRGAKMENMTNVNNLVRLIYTIPSRGLIGFSTDFMTMTKGYGIINHTFKEYRTRENVNIGERKSGALTNSSNALLLYVDNGIGASMIFNNEFYKGCNGYAGEIGLMSSSSILNAPG